MYKSRVRFIYNRKHMKFMPRASGFLVEDNLTRLFSSAVSGTISDALSAQESSQKSEVMMFYFFSYILF